MKKLKYLFLIPIFCTLAISFTCCDEDEPDPPADIPLVYTSLTADKTILNVGETATLTATATGKDLLYLWEASAGSLVGSGQTVTYTPTPCIVGDNEITCTVQDDYGKTESKSITITIQ
jgi:hypothetical protein